MPAMLNRDILILPVFSDERTWSSRRSPRWWPPTGRTARC